MTKIKYTRDKCIGCGVCEMLAPHIWCMNRDDGKADLLDTDTLAHAYRDIFPEEAKIVQEIASSCPVHAIQII